MINFNERISVPERVIFYTNGESEKLLFLATESSSLKNQLMGALRTVTPQGIILHLVVKIKDPLKLGAGFYLSKHNNYHIGFANEKPDLEELRQINPKGVTYYQDQKYFLALERCEVGHDEDVEQYTLYVFKKMEPVKKDLAPRAVQD